MRRLIVFLFVWTIAGAVRSDVDLKLLLDIKTWKPGDRPPARLLKFPDGKIDDFPVCEFRVLGDRVEDYLAEVRDPCLLAAVMFDPRADESSILAAARQLLRKRGPGYLLPLLRQNRASVGEVWLGGQLAVIEQLLQSPYLTLQVAKIGNTDMPLSEAEAALQGMQKKLESGWTWADAYGWISKAHPDPTDSSPAGRTLVCYCFEGIVSSTGFDILSGTFSPNLRRDHLIQLFRLGTGTHVISASDGVYLYHVTDRFAGAA